MTGQRPFGTNVPYGMNDVSGGNGTGFLGL